ncbi:MAG: hypothetical protein ACRD35_02745 [Candidatus Acidiferrales bacterium]
MNRKQLVAVWLLAAWVAFAFFYAARQVEEPTFVDEAKAKLSGEPAPDPKVTYEFVWERDGRKLVMLVVPALLFGVPLILTLGQKK